MEELEAKETPFGVEETTDTAGDPVIALSGELDISNADTLRTVVEAVVGRHPGRLVFDLGQLAFMDSSGIAVMVFAANKIAVVELRDASPIIRRVVEATGLTEILRLDR